MLQARNLNNYISGKMCYSVFVTRETQANIEHTKMQKAGRRSDGGELSIKAFDRMVGRLFCVSFFTCFLGAGSVTLELECVWH